jgi:hypothetical protein
VNGGGQSILEHEDVRRTLDAAHASESGQEASKTQ